MKEIKLTQGQIALVDDEDYESLNQFKWYARKVKNTFYAERNIRIDGKHTRLKMHVKIMNRTWIDHIDGNGCNNQKGNLRLCTHQENLMNSRKQKNSTSKYKGVYFAKRDNVWMARIMINYKRINLGSFLTEIDAAKAYNQKAIELFGEFARLNVIE